MRRVRIRLPDAAGLHARPADLFVRAAKGFRSRVAVLHGADAADGKDIVQILLLGARPGETVVLEVDGPDEDLCTRALSALLTRAPSAERLARRSATGRAYLAVDRPSAVAVGIEEAIGRVRAELRARRAEVAREAGAELAAILGAQEAMLGGSLGDAIRARAAAGAAPQQAVEEACAALADRLGGARSEEARLKAEDARELRDRLLRHLEGRALALPDGPGPWIYVSPRLEVAVVAECRARGVAGFLTSAAEPTAHAAILARGLGLPVAVVPAERLARIAPGEVVTATEDAGPSAPAPKGRGRGVLVRANVSSVEEAIEAFSLGTDGIGLVRTELLFAGASEPPDLEEQVARYAQVLYPFEGHPVVYRLFDAAIDKPVPFLGGPAAARGIARLEAQPEVLRTQLRAVERLAEEAPVRVLVPYVESPDSLVVMPRMVPVGAMIESTSGVARADAICERCDFVSVGTNDLCASVLRRPREHVGLRDVLAREVRDALGVVVAAARRFGREVSICGEAAAEPAAIDLFLELGVDALSVSPHRWSEVVRTLEGR